VARAGRNLIAVLTAPDLWCMEHGAHIVRMLVETKIYLHWMAHRTHPSTESSRSAVPARPSSMPGFQKS